MKTTTLLILVTTCICFSCSGDKSKKHTEIQKTIIEPSEDALPEPQFITDKSEKQIIVITDTLYKGDTLKIKFKIPHSSDLAIVTPDDKFFFVVHDYNQMLKHSLVDWNEFANMEYLEIITDKTKIDPWDARINENQIVFTKTGEYELRLSETLVTDDGTPVEIEKVYYIDDYRN